MASRNLDRFVSEGFRGVEVVKAAPGGQSLLANRMGRIHADADAAKEVGRNVVKADLVRSVAESAGLSRKQATLAVDSVFEAISGALRSGSDVRLAGFGTFTVAARKGASLQSSAKPPRNGYPTVPRFEAGKSLRKSVK